MSTKGDDSASEATTKNEKECQGKTVTLFDDWLRMRVIWRWKVRLRLMSCESDDMTAPLTAVITKTNEEEYHSKIVALDDWSEVSGLSAIVVRRRRRRRLKQQLP